MTRALALALFFCFSTAQADLAYWQICSNCQTLSQFQRAAIESDGEDELVFVSNPTSRETRKFERFTTWEDFGTGPVLMTHVMELDLTSDEESAFTDALQKSQAVFVRITQNEVANFSAGLSPAGSALFDIRTGYLRNSFFRATRLAVTFRGYLPTTDSVGRNAGITIRGIGVNGGTSQSLRTQPLSISVDYPDGSTIEMTYNPDGSWSDITVVDPEGNSIDIQVNANGPNPVDTATLGGDYAFAGDNITDAANDFIDAMNSFNFNKCRMRQVAANRWRLLCRNP